MATINYEKIASVTSIDPGTTNVFITNAGATATGFDLYQSWITG